MTHKTHEEAKALWCPMVRAAREEYRSDCSPESVIVAGCNTDALGGNRVPASCRCIADQCAMWRPGEPRQKKKEITVPISDTAIPNFPAKGLMYEGDAWRVSGYPSKETVRLWRFDDEYPAEPTGYCGLAGRPEFGA